MAQLLDNTAAVSYGLTVMGYQLFTRLLPARLERVLGVREAAVIIASVAEEGARQGFKVFLSRLGVEGIELRDILEIFVVRGEPRHPFQVFSGVESRVEGWALRFTEEASAAIDEHPSTASVYAGVVVGCINAARPGSARFLWEHSAARHLCSLDNPPETIVYPERSNGGWVLVVERLRCSHS